jgi:hypothetical protein
MTPEAVTAEPPKTDVPVTLNVPDKLPFAVPPPDSAGLTVSVKLREALETRRRLPLKLKAGDVVTALEYKVVKVNVWF